jgi:hypothetical protein
MKRVQLIDTSDIQKRKGERGAALVTTLLVSMLLLTAGGALILTTSLSATNAVDSNAEAQAYYAAEAGLQESLNVLRGNSSITNPAFTFATAGDKASGNKSGDSTTYSRLSNWLNYNYTPSGASNPDRVTLTSNYSPLNGLAYSVQVTAPDPENIPVGNNGNKVDTFNKNDPSIGPTPEATPSWHQWHCGHCSWQYAHHNSCTHKHCTNPNGTGRATVDDTRLLVQATGYGPKGAIKNMEMIVKRTVFDYNDAAAAITMVGPPDNSAPITMNITQDSDNHFTGKDQFGGSTTHIAAFGFTSSGAQAAADAYILTLHSGGKPVEATKTVLLTNSTPSPSPSPSVNTSPPPWLASADDARAFLGELQSIAVSMGRYYTTSNQPAAGTYGTDGAPVFTFVDGNFTVPGGKKGGGLLVVTGTLEIQKDAEWDGLILVLGDDPSGNASKFKLTTDGHAKIYGALVIAPFHRIGTSPIPFLGPVFDTSLGGHDAEFKYDSGEVRDAIYTIPPKVVGVHEGLTTVPTN